MSILRANCSMRRERLQKQDHGGDFAPAAANEVFDARIFVVSEPPLRRYDD